jgi:predicted metal-dependent phosphotriesterase family hydrolase
MTMRVRTVLGDIAPAELGATDYHEHLFQISPLLPGDDLDDEAASRDEAGLLRAAGAGAMVEATPTGLGRRPEAVARVSAATGLRIVHVTGAHREAHYAAGSPLLDDTVEQLTDRFRGDLEVGMDGTTVPSRPAPGTGR